MAKPKIIVDSKVHIPIKLVDHEYIEEKLTHYEYENAICAKCEFRPIRPSEECRQCDKGGLLSITALSALNEIKGKMHITIPYGELHNFEKLTDLKPSKCEFVNNTRRKKHDYEVKFTGQLRDYQEEPVKDPMAELSGLLVAPPRSGKTVMGTYVACEHGQRTIIMADQKDFLDGFYETIEQMTNLLELEEIHGKKLFGFPKTDADYKNFQIILITYQSLIKESKTSKLRMKLLNENYGCLIVDECFTRGHRVMTELGLVDIADIAEQKVRPKFALSKNLETGEKEFRAIESRTLKKTRKLCRIHVGGQVIECTPTHLFWSNTRNDYVQAQHLTSEDDLDLNI